MRTRQSLPAHARWLQLFVYLLPAALLTLAPLPVCGDANDPAVARVEQAYALARAQFLRDTNHLKAAWQFGRACFDWAEFARDDAQREEVAQQGIAACRRAIQLDSNSAPAHFYLAMNLGQLARTKLLGALKLVDEMEVEFKAAIALEPRFDHAAPHRSLGLLYFEAPGWPTSIGNKVKARYHLEKAVELAPGYPDNRLVLLEALLHWGERKKVLEQIPDVEEILQTARRELTGDDWELSWKEWDQRWKKIKAKPGMTPTGSSHARK